MLKQILVKIDAKSFVNWEFEVWMFQFQIVYYSDNAVCTYS